MIRLYTYICIYIVYVCTFFYLVFFFLSFFFFFFFHPLHRLSLSRMTVPGCLVPGAWVDGWRTGKLTFAHPAASSHLTLKLNPSNPSYGASSNKASRISRTGCDLYSVRSLPNDDGLLCCIHSLIDTGVIFRQRFLCKLRCAVLCSTVEY